MVRSEATGGVWGVLSPTVEDLWLKKREAAASLFYEPLTRLELATCALRMRCSTD